MKLLLGIELGLAVGFSAGRHLLPHPTPQTFESVVPISLSDEKGVQVAQLPAGRPVVALAQRDFEPDVGWWGCVPVLYSSGFQARELLRAAPGWSLESGPVISAQRVE